MKRLTALFLALFVFASISGCGKKQEASVTKGEAAAVNVSVTAADVQTIEDTVTYTGEIKASEQTSVSAKVGGAAKQVYKQVGDYVRAGEVLLQIDDTDYQTQYNQATASKAQAQAAYEQAAAGKKQAEAAYEQANASYNQANASYNSVTNGTAEQTKIQLKSALDAAEIEYNNAKLNYDNQTVLYEKGSISKTVYDAAVTRYDNAKLNYDTAKSNYELTVGVILEENKTNAQSGVDAAEAGLKSAQAGVNSAQAGVNSAQAALNSANVAIQSAQNSLNNTVVRAPISGYIAARNANKGQMVSPGVEIFSIKSTEKVEAQINVTEAIIPSVSVGTKAKITVEAVGKESIEGIVTKVNPVKDAKTGMYQVSININNTDNKLKEGMFADITLTLKDSVDTLVIPSEAIMEDENGQKYVYIADGNKAKRADINLGIETDAVTEVISGVSKGDKIIVSGKDYLSDKNNKIEIVD